MPNNRTRKVLTLFQELKKILTAENQAELGFIMAGIGDCIDLLEKALGSPVSAEVKRIHKSLYPTRGGLSDYIIFRDDPAEAERLNRKFDAVAQELWDILEN